MKKYILAALLLGSSLGAQIAVGKTTVSGNSSILEFAGMTSTSLPGDSDTGNFRGIILPAVASSPVFNAVTPTTNNPQNGTFLYDKQIRKVRMFENGIWIDMTDESAAVPMVSVATNAQESLSGAGVIIGSNTSSAKGVLVLESSNKSLILPHIKNPSDAVKSPYPGMMCYDTASNSVAVYDGNNWSYWK